MGQTTRYVGIDLAWGAKNTTAVAVLTGDGDPRNGAILRDVADDLLTDADIVAFIAKHDVPGDGLIAAIDAPTIVPNTTGRRPCEAILSRCLRRFEAGPHPANRNLLAGADGLVRGERVVRLLAAQNIPETPYLDQQTEPVRGVFEAFPHPAHVVLFALEKTLKYKAKPKRTLSMRHGVFREYAAYLTALADADPPLRFPDENRWWECDPAQFTKAAALKRHEDALDALTCAYIALYRHRWSDQRTAVVGDLAHGYIVTPVTEDLRKCYAEAAAALTEVSPLTA